MTDAAFAKRQEILEDNIRYCQVMEQLARDEWLLRRKELRSARDAVAALEVRRLINQGFVQGGRPPKAKREQASHEEDPQEQSAKA